MHPSEIKSTLASLGARPNKTLGQHFLIDHAALDAVVAAGNIQKNDRVLEIGPGLGVLTERLLSAGAKVMAIEQDRLFVPYLERRFAGTSLNVTHGDAARLAWDEIVGNKPWKLISNLPYSITSLALRKALWGARPAERVVVLIQREVAERAVARDGKTSLLSLMVALASSSAHIVRRVPAGAFFPPPKVESAILEIIPMDHKGRLTTWGIDPEQIMSLAKRGFAHPRKQLASNLSSLSSGGKITIESALQQIGLDPKVRAEALLPNEWAALTKQLS